MHKTLERQIKKFLSGADVSAPHWQDFLTSIDQAYIHFDEDRQLMNRSLEISSRELMDFNEKIATEKAKGDIVLESISDALFVTEKNATISLINKSGEILLDCDSDAMKGKMFSDLVLSINLENGESVPPEKQPIQMAISTGNKVTGTFLLVKKDSSRFLAQISANPYTINHQIAGVACIVRDVTKEKEIDRAKSEFVSLASHQLRTPLSTIGWYTEMLLAGDAGAINDEQKGYLEEIYHGNKRMVDLVNALLNVSRIELGTFMLTPEPVDFVELSKSVIKEVQPQIHEHVLNFEEKYQPNLPVVPADGKLSRILFQNLITNAIKYTPPNGKVIVSLSTALGKDMGHGNPTEEYVLFSVADTGYGIPKKQADKIFTKLFRADNVREKETDGTGLGLYLVRSVLEACGGEVWFDSEENKGTTFYVIVPLSGMRAKKGEKALI